MLAQGWGPQAEPSSPAAPQPRSDPEARLPQDPMPHPLPGLAVGPYLMKKMRPSPQTP